MHTVSLEHVQLTNRLRAYKSRFAMPWTTPGNQTTFRPDEGVACSLTVSPNARALSMRFVRSGPSPARISDIGSTVAPPASGINAKSEPALRSAVTARSTMAPWAKLKTPEALKIRTKPSATSE